MEAAPWILLIPGGFLAALLLCLNIYRRWIARRPRRAGTLNRDAGVDHRGFERELHATRLERSCRAPGVARGRPPRVRRHRGRVRLGGKPRMFMAAMGLLADNASAQGSVRFEGEEILSVDSVRLNRNPRLEAHHDLPGSDDFADAAFDHRDPALRGAGPPRGCPGRRHGSPPTGCWSACACPNPCGGSISIRTSCRAACASG